MKAAAAAEVVASADVVVVAEEAVVVVAEELLVADAVVAVAASRLLLKARRSPSKRASLSSPIQNGEFDLFDPLPPCLLHLEESPLFAKGLSCMHALRCQYRFVFGQSTSCMGKKGFMIVATKGS